MFAATIQSDLACINCEYNLRGLSTESRCPECGVPIAETLETIPSGEFPELDEQIDAIHRARFEPIARSAHVSVDAAMFVFDAWRAAATKPRRVGLPLALRIATAIDICKEVRELAREYFNDESEARELFGEWGLRNGEDIGRVIFAMIDAGWIRSNSDASVKQFAGLFSLDTLFVDPA
ncbi:MAG TPA: hypothetical protein VH475_18805 [Tepidisphaeraceae bacterium]